MTLLATERQLYSDVWNSLPQYGEHSPGERFLPIFLDIVGDHRGSVLDAGCGSGKGALALADKGFDPVLCDLTPDGLHQQDLIGVPFVAASLWHSLDHLGTFSYVYCCDVLEHVPTQFTMLAVRNMLAVAHRGMFMSVSLVPDNFGVWVGESLHQTVESFQWWRDSLREVGEVVDARDLILSATFFMRPRP